MTKRIFLLQFIFISFMISCFGQIDENLPYDELESSAINYLRAGNNDSAIILLEYALENFPEELGSSTRILAQVYTRTGNYSRATEIWEMGINKGYFYGLNNISYQEYYKDNADFERLAKIEKSRMDTMHVKSEIILPSGFNPEKTYPVLFIFHGNNRNIEKSKMSWDAPIMNKEFITVFLQSYFPSSPIDFRWVPKDEKIKKEFEEIYKQILTDYPVDEAKIIFAGMSAGGYKALEFTMNNYFPTTGLVLNCPVIPRDITDEMTTDFVEKNKKIGIITGENDFALENQEILINTIDSLGGQSRIIVTEGLGHNFAENFTELLNEYLLWVIE